MDLDMVNRDPNNLNDHCRALFEDVIGEPEAPRSIDCVWRNSYKCYTCGLSCCYKFLTTICGIFIALYWGCEFACLSCCCVWCSTPCLKSYQISCGYFQKMYGICINCWLAPCCEACGLFFSRIYVNNK